MTGLAICPWAHPMLACKEKPSCSETPLVCVWQGAFAGRRRAGACKSEFMLSSLDVQEQAHVQEVYTWAAHFQDACLAQRAPMLLGCQVHTGHEA